MGRRERRWACIVVVLLRDEMFKPEGILLARVKRKLGVIIWCSYVASIAAYRVVLLLNCLQFAFVILSDFQLPSGQKSVLWERINWLVLVILDLLICGDGWLLLLVSRACNSARHLLQLLQCCLLHLHQVIIYSHHFSFTPQLLLLWLHLHEHLLVFKLPFQFFSLHLQGNLLLNRPDLRVSFCFLPLK